MAAQKIRKVCKAGHVFYKTSSCLVCPVCEKQNAGVPGVIKELAAPARRALENAGIDSLEKLATKTEGEILRLHGMGPASLPLLLAALKEKGLAFKQGK